MKKTNEQIVAILLNRVEVWKGMYSPYYIERFFTIYDYEQTAVFETLAQIPNTTALVASVKTLLEFLPVYDLSCAGHQRVEAVKAALNDLG